MISFKIGLVFVHTQLLFSHLIPIKPIQVCHSAATVGFHWKLNLRQHPSIYSRYSLTDLWRGEDLGEVEVSEICCMNLQPNVELTSYFYIFGVCFAFCKHLSRIAFVLISKICFFATQIGGLSWEGGEWKGILPAHDSWAFRLQLLKDV